MSSMNTNKRFYKNNVSIILEKKNLICFLIIILTFFLDRISKIKILDHQLYNNRVYINDFINFDLVWNTGVGFGLFSFNSNLIYNSISAIIGIVIIFLIYWLIKSVFIDKIAVRLFFFEFLIIVLKLSFNFGKSK